MEPLVWLGSHRAPQVSVKLDKTCCLHAGSDVLKGLSVLISSVTLEQGEVGITDFLLVISCLEFFFIISIYLLPISSKLA